MGKGETVLRSFSLLPTNENEKNRLEELYASKGNLPEMPAKKVMGIGFVGEEITLNLANLEGEILEKESIRTGLFKNFKGKVKEFNAIVDEVADKRRLRAAGVALVGVALPASMAKFNPRGSEVLSDGFRKIFGGDVFIGAEATASGYGEKRASAFVDADAVLYMHSDIGTGIVVKKETIYESQESEDSYMRPWAQFGIVCTARELVDKGVGTDIVNIVKGNLDDITLDVVLQAAGNKDELAEDLVKRAGFAMGVRVAYLVNMFDTPKVIVGGGVEKKGVNFIGFVQESAQRFLSEDAGKDFEILPGALGKDASATGAALLCRREIYMEV